MPLLTAEHLKQAEENGLKRRTVMNRVYNMGMDVDRAISEPVIVPPLRWADWKDKAVVHKATFFQRVGRGMDPFTAATKPPAATRGKKNV